MVLEQTQMGWMNETMICEEDMASIEEQAFYSYSEREPLFSYTSWISQSDKGIVHQTSQSREYYMTSLRLYTDMSTAWCVVACWNSLTSLGETSPSLFPLIYSALWGTFARHIRKMQQPVANTCGNLGVLVRAKLISLLISSNCML